MGNIELLNQILTGNNVAENFYKHYNSNAEFKKWLIGILPEVDLCEKQQQDNPWHIYNVLGHILHSVEHINALSKNLDSQTRLNLAYAMFLHDIGKPVCHIRREKDGKMIDSFFKHNIESSKIAKRVLPSFGFDSINTNIIAKLVLKHDIFMFITEDKKKAPNHRELTKQLVLDEINNLSDVGNGFNLMRQLVMVGKADNLAQNPQMTQSSLHKLSTFDKILDEIEAENEKQNVKVS